MVVGHHYHLVPFLGGVDLFFVLSGFLLGGILLHNREAPNYFKAFYARRTCRIFPLYFLSLLLFFVLLATPSSLGWLFGDSSEWLFGKSLPSWSYFTFTQNIAMAEQGYFGAKGLDVTWSLAVEEQFYLVLPFLVRFVSIKKLPYLLAGLILAAPLLRLALLDFQPERNLAFYVLMPCKADALLLGVLCAYAARDERFMSFLRAHTRVLYGALAVLMTGALVMLFHTAGPKNLATIIPPSYGYTWFALLYSCVLLIAITEKQGLITFVTRRRFLGGLAVVAFGAYLFHKPVLGSLHGLILGQKPHMETWSDLIVTLGALVLTLALASLSWIFFEKRIVSWGRSFKYENVAETYSQRKRLSPKPSLARNAMATFSRMKRGQR